MISLNNSQVVSGKALFELQATHGFPLAMALDMIIAESNLSIDWPEFIEAARSNGWWDFQTFKLISHALVDAELPRPYAAAVEHAFKAYVMANPHPEMVS